MLAPLESSQSQNSNPSWRPWRHARSPDDEDSDHICILRMRACGGSAIVGIRQHSAEQLRNSDPFVFKDMHRMNMRAGLLPQPVLPRSVQVSQQRANACRDLRHPPVRGVSCFATCPECRCQGSAYLYHISALQDNGYAYSRPAETDTFAITYLPTPISRPRYEESEITSAQVGNQNSRRGRHATSGRCSTILSRSSSNRR